MGSYLLQMMFQEEYKMFKNHFSLNLNLSSQQWWRNPEKYMIISISMKCYQTGKKLSPDFPGRLWTLKYIPQITF